MRVFTRLSYPSIFVLNGAFPDREAFDQTGHQSGPAGLMAGAQTLPCFAMKILVEKDHFLDPGSLIFGAFVAVTGPLAGGVGHKQPDQPMRQLMRCFL